MHKVWTKTETTFGGTKYVMIFLWISEMKCFLSMLHILVKADGFGLIISLCVNP